MKITAFLHKIPTWVHIEAILMSTHNKSFYDKLTEYIIQLLSKTCIILYLGFLNTLDIFVLYQFKRNSKPIITNAVFDVTNALKEWV